jgi:hypothetical protein
MFNLKMKSVKTLILSLLGVAVFQTVVVAQTSGTVKQQPAPAAKVSSGSAKQNLPSVKPSNPTPVKSNQPKGKATQTKPAFKPVSSSKPNSGSGNKVKKDGTSDMRYKDNKQSAPKAK